MLIDRIINTAYKNLIIGILNGVPDADKEEVSNNYLNYLFSRYSDLEVTEENAKRCLASIFKKENRMWGDQDLNYRLQKLKTDKSFDIISKISEQGFSLAKQKLENGSNAISKEDAEKNIDILISELSKVMDYNAEEARELVSEGILDYDFASGSADEIISLRLNDEEKFHK